MTVKELIAELGEIADQNRIVIMQKDGEGNGYSPLSCVETDAYWAETTWSGDVGLEPETPGGVPALILVPTN